MTRSKLSWPLIFLALYVAASATIDSATAQSPDEAAKKAADDTQKELDQIYDQWIKTHPKMTPECAREYNKTVAEFVNSIFNQTASPDKKMTRSTNMTAYVEDWAIEVEKNLTRCVDKADGSYSSANVLGLDYYYYNVHFVLASFAALLFLFV